MKINDVDELFTYLLQMQMSGQYVFRGISKEYQKYPKLIRDANPESIDLDYYEKIILNEFVNKSSSLLSGNLVDMDIVGYAQHHGLPTRLIDWSKNPFVALFFAINSKSSDDKGYRIFAFDTIKGFEIDRLLVKQTYDDLSRVYDTKLNTYFKFIDDIGQDEGDVNKVISYYDEYPIYKESEEFEELRGSKHLIPIFYRSNLSNKRVINQQGLYLIPDILTKSRIDSYYDTNFCNEVTIDKSIIDTAIDKLENMGINQTSLFYDLDNIATDVLNKYKRLINEHNSYFENLTDL